MKLPIAALVVCALFTSSCSDDATTERTKPNVSLVTFNTGMPQLQGEPGDYVDQYGNGLAWKPLVADTRVFFESASPDIALFQEIFHPEECVSVTPEAKPGFVCEDWQSGDPTVVQMLLGADYQVACNLGKPDKCLAVKKSFGSLVGCSDDVCLDGLAGSQVPDCGSGSRVGRGVIQLARDGSLLTVVNVHGSSGLTQADQDCRVLQFAQVFEELGIGDGPAANGERNVIAGDLNTDPGRMTDYDESASAFSAYVGTGTPFHFVSAVGPKAPPTYGGLFNIDHVVSDALGGSCTSAGKISDIGGFDHEPLVCRLTL